MKRLIIFLVIIIVLISLFVWRTHESHEAAINSFEECAASGYPVMESYPRQCRTNDGRTFTEDIGNELEKQDLIYIETPRPNDIIESPVTIKGSARGYWFFEASFPIKLFDGDNNLLGIAIAQAKSDWMTEDFVGFEAELVFENPATDRGVLVLEKDNPSGLPENADELRVPVGFQKGAAIANPAAVYCKEQGGASENRLVKEGEKGFCVFADGSECDEWEFFRGECEKGERVCKDLCGDGTCQEIVCMAIGCPCAETNASCPQDCE